ncbi:hypothetical protein BK769_09715 [Bacillus thuringiensis serovar kumamtoensis]|uniref:IS4 family transposase n=1 Tax=Bacillus thuringiensis serovar kumamotoensis TaxID=132267 RepID=A0A9X6JST5_BACUK|nr:hypothetical protein BK769_09715 [Bacillus thuringiensis serovar kumamtoensis]
MNLSIQDEFHLFTQELKRYLSSPNLQQLAQETGFVKHKSKYGTKDLATLCIWIRQYERKFIAPQLSLIAMYSAL